MRESVIRAENKVGGGLCRCASAAGSSCREELSPCEHAFGDVNNIGTPTVVVFRTIINISLLLGVMLLVYSIFALVTNLEGANETGYLKNTTLVISLAAKSQENGANNDKGDR